MGINYTEAWNAWSLQRQTYGYLPSRRAPLPVGGTYYYTALWQRHMCVNNLPKVATRKRNGRNSNPRPFELRVQRSGRNATRPRPIGWSSPPCWGQASISSQERGPKDRERRWVLGGRGSQPPLQQLRDLGERCKLPSGVLGRTSAAKRFSCIFEAPDGISWILIWYFGAKLGWGHGPLVPR